MAYISQEKKAKIAPAVKSILKKYGMKGSLSIRNHSTLILTCKSGNLDVIGNWKKVALDSFHPHNDPQNARKNQIESVTYINVNTYHMDDHYDGEVLDFLKEVDAALNDGNFDHSDSQTDYFHVGWYVDINIGTWDKPYQVI